jgi:hypothetical protein
LATVVALEHWTDRLCGICSNIGNGGKSVVGSTSTAAGLGLGFAVLRYAPVGEVMLVLKLASGFLSLTGRKLLLSTLVPELEPLKGPPEEAPVLPASKLLTAFCPPAAAAGDGVGLVEKTVRGWGVGLASVLIGIGAGLLWMVLVEKTTRGWSVGLAALLAPTARGLGLLLALPSTTRTGS